ncbi:hypothetical protein ACOW85_000167 [Vibrio parahaemolyticus]
MSLPSSVRKPSDYLVAVSATFHQLLNSEKDRFDIYDYGEFGRKDITRPTIVVEYYKAPGINREPDGRLYEDLEMWVHCVYPSSIPKAEQKAADLSFEIRSSVIADVPSTRPEKVRVPRWNWGLASDSVRRPTNIDRQASMFKNGDKGYEAWAVTFIQRVIYGDVNDDEDTRDQIAISFNDHVDDPDSYRPISDDV